MFSILGVFLLQALAVSSSGLSTNSTQQATRCKVFTFFEDLTGGIKFQSNKKVHLTRQDHLQVLRAWLRNWYANGWSPEILRLSDSATYPGYSWYQKRFATFPTVNWRAYEMTCYLRWLAFAEKGGGVFVDYDIMNFPVQNIPVICGPCGNSTMTNEPGDMLVSYPKFWPMLVFGGRPAAEKLIRALAEYELDPEQDQFNGQPHISDMIIVQNIAEHLFDVALPNPRSLWHFSTASKAKLAEKLGAENGGDVLGNLTRSEWVRRTLTVAFIQRHRIQLLSMAGNLDGSLESLLMPLRECPEHGTPEHRIVHDDVKMSRGEYPICEFRLVTKLTAEEIPNQWQFLFLESLEEQVLRAFTGKSARDLTVFYNRASHNQLVYKLAASWLDGFTLETDAQVREAVELLKAKLATRNRLFVGFMHRLMDTKIALEYTLGIVLPELTRPYVPPTVQHRIKLTDDQRMEIQKLNWADAELLRYLEDTFQVRLNAIKQVEFQLDKYHDAPLSFIE